MKFIIIKSLILMSLSNVFKYIKQIKYKLLKFQKIVKRCFWNLNELKRLKNQIFTVYSEFDFWDDSLLDLKYIIRGIMTSDAKLAQNSAEPLWSTTSPSIRANNPHTSDFPSFRLAMSNSYNIQFPMTNSQKLWFSPKD